MPPEKRSQSRGKVTITLSNPKDELDETAKVIVTLPQPEKMVERVVNQLARKFPADTIMTIDTLGPGEYGSTCKPVSRKSFRLLHEEVTNTQPWTVQSYLLSDELDIAIPVTPLDVEVKLNSGARIPINPSDVVTCIYGPSGFIEVVQKGYYNEHAHLKHNNTQSLSLPTKPGVALFVQHVVINNEVFDAAVPICPGQALVHLSDGDVYNIRPEPDTHAVFFSEKGLARFTASKSNMGPSFIGQVIEPGIPSAAKVPSAAVPHRILLDESLPLALSSATKAITAGEKRINVSLYDETGAFVCQRSIDGGILPRTNARSPQHIPVDHIRYIWIPSARMSRSRKPAQVVRLAPHCGPAELADGTTADPCLPQDVDIVLFNSNNDEVGALVADRKPSLIMGSSEEVRNYIPSYIAASTTASSDSVNSAEEESNSSATDMASYTRAGHRKPVASASSSDDESTEAKMYVDKRKSRCRADSENEEGNTDCLISRRQAYFKPAEIDYAIPLTPGQSHVKLITGDRLKVEVSRTFIVAYDMKGFPAFTIYPDGRRESWAANQTGVAIQVQDFYVDDELVSAIPITPSQTEIAVSDGGVIDVREDNIITVFYDALGRPAFTYTGRKKRIRPGLASYTGIASAVQYAWLIDCDSTGEEQYVVPVRGFQKKVTSPHDPAKIMKIQRDKLTVLFLGERKEVLYTKLADGSLVSGGLTPVDNCSQDGESYQRVYNNSEEADIMSVRKSVDGRFAGDTISTVSSRKVIERQMPIQKIEYRDKIVEVPEVHVVEKHVEVEHVEYVTKYVKKKQVIERPLEHVKYVPKIETKIVERVIEIPKIVEVERKEIIEQKVQVDRFIDEKQEVVVANKVVPNIVDDESLYCEVKCLRLEPELIPVDVYVPKLVYGKLRGLGVSKEARRPVDISLGHFNSLVLHVNEHLGENYERLPLLKINEGNTYPMLNRDAKVRVHTPTDQEIHAFLKATGIIDQGRE